MKKNEETKTDNKNEFVDENGEKWIQTSTDDLMSLREIKEIIGSLERDRNQGEIVLAKIDFQKVNREYYDAVQELEAKLKLREAQLQKVANESIKQIQKKNAKLKELITYIKKLHQAIEYLNQHPEERENRYFLETFIPRQTTRYTTGGDTKTRLIETEIIEYSPVEEIDLDKEGNEII